MIKQYLVTADWQDRHMRYLVYFVKIRNSLFILLVKLSCFSFHLFNSISYLIINHSLFFIFCYNTRTYLFVNTTTMGNTLKPINQINIFITK